MSLMRHFLFIGFYSKGILRAKGSPRGGLGVKLFNKGGDLQAKAGISRPK